MKNFIEELKQKCLKITTNLFVLFTKHINWSSLIVNQNVKWGSLKTLNKKKYGLAVIFKHFCYIVKLLNSGTRRNF